MTPPQAQHTRPLTRRQRIALGLETYVPIERTQRPKQKTRPSLRIKPVPQPKEQPVILSRRERIDLSIKEDLRREKTAAWIKTVPLDQWRQWIQEDEKKFYENEEQKEKERAESAWYAQTLDEMRRTLGIRGRYYYSEDRKTVYLNVQCRPEQETEVYVSIDAEDLERVAVKEWTMRTGDGSSRIVCLADKTTISLDRFIACSYHRRHVSHLNGDRLDYHKSNLHPVFPAPPPNAWGNYFPAWGKRAAPAPPVPLIPPPDSRSYAQFYGPKWKEVQTAAMARSHGKCEKCKRRKAKHVHHILLVRYFLDPEDAHYLENTLAVCLRCHHEEHRQTKRRFPLFNGLKYKFV